MSDYICIVCQQPCKQEPFLEEKLWWFGISALRAIHHGCLEALWDIYQNMQNPEVEFDDDPPEPDHDPVKTANQTNGR